MRTTDERLAAAKRRAEEIKRQERSRRSRIAAVSGADGLMIEVHNDPPHALCDGAQSLDFGQFEKVMGELKQLRETV